MTESIIHQSAEEIGCAIARLEADPRDILTEYFNTIDNNPISKKIFSILTKERAFAEADYASQRAKTGKRLSHLDGVPVSWKDLYDTRGIATEAGSLLLEGRCPNSDAKVLEIGTNAGLVCLGRTHMSELAFSGLGFNPKTATPPCVNDMASVAGGSSSGAAASVAFGMAAAGIGSDTGGSVRIPACWNDLVGFKPTHGTISLEGVVPLCLSFDTVGPLCRSVKDTSLFYATFIKQEPFNLDHASLEGKLFLVLQADSLDYVRKEPQQGFEQCIARIKEQGAVINFAHCPEIDRALALAGCLYCVEAYSIWKEVIEANPDKMFDFVRDRFLSGKDYSGDDFSSAWRELNDLRQSFQVKTGGYDGFLLPTSPILPPKVARLEKNEDFYTTENLYALRNTRVSNLFNLPCLTLPTGIPSTGISIIGHTNQDLRLLRLGKAIEDAIQD